jgi:hypothetical protein
MPDNESLLSSSDEEEIHKYMLNDEEKVIKSVIWHEMNKEWIQEQKEKEVRIKKATKPQMKA